MSFSYPLHDLTWQEFEKLVILICDKVLGIGTINFSSGKDGGRDGKFAGTARNFPDDKKPWAGNFIIQAKHTEIPTAKSSDNDFKLILKKEISKLKKLVKNEKLKYYLIFTNRRLSAIANAAIIKSVEKNLKIKSCILGIERIQLWLKQYPDIAKAADLNRLLLPFQFYEDDLVKIVVQFSNNKKQIREIAKKAVDKFGWVNKEKKNQLNNLSKEYFDFMRRTSLPYFLQIDKFLQDPKNQQYKNSYESTILDLQEKILLKRSQYKMFEEIFNDIYEYVLNNNVNQLGPCRKLIRILLHYMYFNCDVGRSK